MSVWDQATVRALGGEITIKPVGSAGLTLAVKDTSDRAVVCLNPDQAVALADMLLEAGLELYQAQGMSEAQARALVLRDMDAAAVNAGLATAGWEARKRPLTPGGEVTAALERIAGGSPTVLPGGPVNPGGPG